MNIYVLRSKSYKHGYDCAHGFVVVHFSEQEARELIAQDKGWNIGDEGADTWLNPGHSDCDNLGKYSGNDDPHIVMEGL